jgi:molybdenum cofactor biosynthesis enzyme
MATQEYAASIQGVSIRVTRLDSVGNLLTGPADSYTTSAFMRISFTPEYEEGDEITEKGANGVVCVTYKAPDTLKRITMELAICEPDPELSALLSGGLLLRKNMGTAGNVDTKSVGWAAPGVGDDPAGNGVAIEAWSHAVKDGKRAGLLPYFHWIFPYAKFRQSGDRVIENGLMANTFEGYGLGNASFQSGIDGRWEFPVAAERPYAYARTDWAPTGLSGFYTWTDNATDQVIFTSTTAKQPTTKNVTKASATLVDTTGVLTFSAAHNLAVGDVIYVQNVSASLNGTQTISAVTTSTPFTVQFVSSAITADVTEFTITNTGARVTAANSVTESHPAPIASTSAQIGVGGSTFNVPGNVNYSEDAAIDNIIGANEIG